MFFLGVRFATGECVVKNSERAVALYRRAAELGQVRCATSAPALRLELVLTQTRGRRLVRRHEAANRSPCSIWARATRTARVWRKIW
jgi:TPR repeat protein